MNKGFPVERGSTLGLLLEAALRQPPETVECSDCGKEVPYDYVAHHYVQAVHGGIAEVSPDWYTRFVCRNCDCA